MADNLPGEGVEGHMEAVAELSQRQGDYTAAVTAAMRVAGRHELRKKPTSMVEVGLLQLEEQRRMNRVLEGMLDVQRAVVSRRFTIAVRSLY